MERGRFARVISERLRDVREFHNGSARCRCLGADLDPAASNPEQLLVLAWATCLNATAQVINGGAARTSVRVEVALVDAEPGPGFEFHVHAYLSLEGASLAETEKLLAAAEARCPVSKLLRGATTVRAHAEPYSAP